MTDVVCSRRTGSVWVSKESYRAQDILVMALSRMGMPWIRLGTPLAVRCVETGD